jgi:hypothetical protein
MKITIIFLLTLLFTVSVNAKPQRFNTEMIPENEISLLAYNNVIPKTEMTQLVHRDISPYRPLNHENRSDFSQWKYLILLANYQSVIKN